MNSIIMDYTRTALLSSHMLIYMYILSYLPTSPSFAASPPEVHEIVQPVIFHHGRYRRDTTRVKDGHVHSFSMALRTRNETYIMDLTKNRFVISPHLTIRTFAKTGEIISRPNHTVDSHCFYHGKVRGHEQSLVSLSTCNGIRGMVVTNETFYIHPAQNSTSGDHMWWSAKDDPYEFKCGTGNHDMPSLPRLKRDINRGRKSLNWPSKDGEDSKIVELYIVADYAQHRAHGDKVTQRAQETAAHASALYSQLGVHIVLVGLEVWNRGDRIQVVSSSEKTLGSFRKYRAQEINPRFQNDNAQMMTGARFSDGVIGKASIGTMCTGTYSTGINMDHRFSTGAVATTMAHEMGHNFGMAHDSRDCYCRSDNCIMAASSSHIDPVEWSSCSTKTLRESWDKGMDYCLHNLPERSHGGPTCGDGVVEGGEQCDCGPKQFCSNKCCDANTCRLAVNATCATGECCDKNTCQLKPAKTSCRPVKDQSCDLPEFCTGTSEWCPADIHKYNGCPCQNYRDESYCYQGVCRTHDNQCRILWGYSGRKADDKCYSAFNTYGSGHGSCGYDWVTDKYTKCAKENVMCGSLMCEKASSVNKWKFWQDMYVRTSFSGTVMSSRGAAHCNSVVLDTGLSKYIPNPSFVLDGTRCDEGKVCMNNRCQDLADLGFRPHSDCNGHGVSTTSRTCYCDPGWAPPDCKEPGEGGSKDSGPPSKPNIASTGQGRAGVIAGVLVPIMLLVILVVILFVVYRRKPEAFDPVKQRLSFKTRRGRATRPAQTAPTVATVSSPVLDETTNTQQMWGGAPLASYNEGYPGQRKSSIPAAAAYENIAFAGGRRMSRRPSRSGRRLSSVCNDCGSLIFEDENGIFVPRSPLSPVFVPQSPKSPGAPPKPKNPPNVAALRAKYNQDEGKDGKKPSPGSQGKVELNDGTKSAVFSKGDKPQEKKALVPNIAALRARLENKECGSQPKQDSTASTKNDVDNTQADKSEGSTVSAHKNKLSETDRATSSPLKPGNGSAGVKAPALPHLNKQNRPKLPKKV